MSANPHLPPIEWLTPDEKTAISLNFAMTRGERGFTAEELSAVFNEFISARMQKALLDKIITGDLKCDWNGSEILMGLADHLRTKEGGGE